MPKTWVGLRVGLQLLLELRKLQKSFQIVSVDPTNLIDFWRKFMSLCFFRNARL